MFESLNQWDTKAFLWLNRQHWNWLDEVMYYISETKTWIPFYGFLIFLIFRKLPLKKAFLAIISIGLMVTLTDQISSSFFKPTFHRLRPSHEPSLEKQIHLVHNYTGGDFGFISSHAANTFGLAMFLFLLFNSKTLLNFSQTDENKAEILNSQKKSNVWWSLLFVWAALVSYSRIYLGVHYPLDVLSGALLGVLCASGIFQFTKFTMKKIN